MAPSRRRAERKKAPATRESYPPHFALRAAATLAVAKMQEKKKEKAARASPLESKLEPDHGLDLSLFVPAGIIKDVIETIENTSAGDLRYFFNPKKRTSDNLPFFLLETKRDEKTIVVVNLVRWNAGDSIPTVSVTLQGQAIDTFIANCKKRL